MKQGGGKGEKEKAIAVGRLDKHPKQLWPV